MQTAHIIEEVKLNCFEAGCDEFLEKPFDEALFYQLINSYLIKKTNHNLIIQFFIVFRFYYLS